MYGKHPISRVLQFFVVQDVYTSSSSVLNVLMENAEMKFFMTTYQDEHKQRIGKGFTF